MNTEARNPSTNNFTSKSMYDVPLSSPTSENKQENETIIELQKSFVHTFLVVEKIKNTLIDTLDESKKAQVLSKIMFTCTFLLGFILIGFALYFGIEGRQFLAIVFGSFGMIDIIAHLIADPPLKIQDSRSNYMQLTIGILAWFSDFINNNTILGQVDSTNMALKNYILQNSENLPLEVINSQLRIYQDDSHNNYLKLSESLYNQTFKLLNVLDEVAEPSKKKGLHSKETLANKLENAITS